MVDNMIDVYATYGVRVHRVSDETLNLPLLNDLDVGACTMGSVTTEQTQLMANRNSAAPTTSSRISCVRPTRHSTVAPRTQPTGRRRSSASIASEWTLGHEVGHVLGLRHVTPADRLMMGGGTNNITNPPPDLIASEVQTMDNSPFTQNLG